MLQHHAVMKPDSTTTKCRAVFNGSAKTSNGMGLNECLLVGPKQPELFDILVNYRFKPIGLSGDVTKMYRQVRLNDDAKSYHQMFWGREPTNPIKRYRMTVVIYGISSSSYHAIRALRDTAERAKSPEGKDAILNSFFVDDFLGGSSSPEKVKALYQYITDTLASIGMQVRKRAGNSK